MTYSSNELLNRAEDILVRYLDNENISESEAKELVSDIEKFNESLKSFECPPIGTPVWIVEISTNKYYTTTNRSNFTKTATRCKTIDISPINVSSRLQVSAHKTIYNHTIVKMYNRPFHRSHAAKLGKSIFTSEEAANKYFDSLGDDVYEQND